MAILCLSSTLLATEETQPRITVGLTEGCHISVARPQGWEFNGSGTMYYSPNVVRVQMHFDPRGAEITIHRDGWNSVLSDIRIAKGQRASIRVDEHHSQWPARNRAVVEFDEAMRWQGVRDMVIVINKCDRPIAFDLRYYPSSGLAKKWMAILEDVVSSVRVVRTKPPPAK